MWHSAQRTEISEEKWMYVQPEHCQAMGTTGWRLVLRRDRSRVSAWMLVIQTVFFPPVVLLSPSKQKLGLYLKLGHTYIHIFSSSLSLMILSFNAIKSNSGNIIKLKQMWIIKMKLVKGILFTSPYLKTNKTWFFNRILNKIYCYPTISTWQRNSSLTVIHV
jgi:hypothetical protein